MVSVFNKILVVITLLFVTTLYGDNTTTVGRLELLHPNLGHTGGTALHTHINDIYTKLSNNINSRILEVTVPASSTSTVRHNFNIAFDQLRVLLYDGQGSSATRITTVSSPSLSDFVVTANGTNPRLEIDIQNTTGSPEDLTVVVTWGKGSEILDDLEDVDVTTTPPQDGQALVYDSGASEWVPGASGDASFKCQSVASSLVSIKAGNLILADGRELQLANDTSFNLTTILGSAPANNTTYYLYIDLDAVPSEAVVADRTVVTINNTSHFDLFTTTPSGAQLERYVPVCFIHSADSGSTWSGTGSTFGTLAVRRHDKPVENVNPIEFSSTNTVTGFGGTTGTIVHNKNIAIANQYWFAVVDDGSVKTQLSGSDFVTDKTVNDVDYDFTGLAGTDTVTVYLQNVSFTATTIATRTYNSGELSSAPSFPINHGLPGRPLELAVWTEGQSLSGQWDKRIDLCSATATQINCDLSSLTIDGTHRVQIVASMTPGGTAVRCADSTEAGLVCTTEQTFSGNKTLSNNLSVTGTVQIGGNETIDAYDETTSTCTLTGDAGIFASTQNFTIRLVRIGKLVTLRFPSANQPADGTPAATQTCTGAIPVGFRPGASLAVLFQAFGSSVDQIDSGCISIATNGDILFSFKCNFTTSWPSTNNNGWGGFAASYPTF